MGNENYCLVDEGWIPVVEHGRVSLLDVFSDESLQDIEGNPIEKISLIKLFIAIAQAAISLADADSWASAGPVGISKAVCEYLIRNRKYFNLYGDRPFLQMPILATMPDVEPKTVYFSYAPDLASENDTILRELQGKHQLDDAQMALFIIQLMNYAPGGKRVSFSSPLTEGYPLKTKSAKAGPSLGGHDGYLQVCMKGKSILETVWLNFLTVQDIKELKGHDAALSARPPWELMPLGEDDERARELKNSVYSWLVALSRFVLIDDDEIRYVEGLQYLSSAKDGYVEPFITIDRQKSRIICANTSKHPWRWFEAMLQTVYLGNQSAYSCPILNLHWKRTRDLVDDFSIWAGGLKIRANSGDQSVKQDDDYVESEIELSSEFISSEAYYRLKEGISDVEKMGWILMCCVEGYFKDMGMEKKGRNNIAKRFWAYADLESNRLLKASLNGDDKELDEVFSRLSAETYRVYDDVCSHDTARQRMAWIKNRKLGFRRNRNAK